MKTLFTLFTFFLLLIVGCSDQTSITAPEENQQYAQTQEPNWISFPQSSDSQLLKGIYNSVTLDGSQGYTWEWNASISGILVSSTLVFQPNSFSGIKTITANLDRYTCLVTFGPSMNFDIPLSLSLSYKGIDLSGINPQTVKFAYIAADGSVQFAPNDGITIDKVRGILSVRKAKIPHFSRYGFVN
jgi:hypothetical protein